MHVEEKYACMVRRRRRVTIQTPAALRENEAHTRVRIGIYINTIHIAQFNYARTSIRNLVIGFRRLFARVSRLLDFSLFLAHARTFRKKKLIMLSLCGIFNESRCMYIYMFGLEQARGLRLYRLNCEIQRSESG